MSRLLTATVAAVALLAFAGSAYAMHGGCGGSKSQTVSVPQPVDTAGPAPQGPTEPDTSG